MIYLLYLCLVVAITIANVARVAATCPESNLYSTYLGYLFNPTYTINFDDQNWTTDVPSTLDSPWEFSVSGISIRITGQNCQIQKTLATLHEETSWIGNAVWYEETEMPGYFMTTTDENSTCTFEFDPPVSQIVMRAMCGKYVFGELRAYDSVGTEVGCSMLGHIAGQNIYMRFGWTGFKQIAKLEYTGGLFAIDEIQIRAGCSEGEYWNQGKCTNYDECNFGECNENANCISPNNVVQCTCKLGFEGDGFGPNGCYATEGCPQEVVCPAGAWCYNNQGNFTCECDGYYFEENSFQQTENKTCVDLDECSRTVEEGYPCVPEASCNNIYRGFECNCPEGYEGTGIRWDDGCTLIDLCKAPGPCSPFAKCESYNGVTLNCTCNEGYEGDGIGAGGCVAVTPDTPAVAPVVDQSPQSSNSPASNTPMGNNTPKNLLVSSGTMLIECLSEQLVQWIGVMGALFLA